MELWSSSPECKVRKCSQLARCDRLTLLEEQTPYIQRITQDMSAHCVQNTPFFNDKAGGVHNKQYDIKVFTSVRTYSCNFPCRHNSHLVPWCLSYLSTRWPGGVLCHAVTLTSVAAVTSGS